MIERENREESGPEIRPLVVLREEPHSVLAYCCAGEPVSVDQRPAGSTAQTGYMHCPVWRAERERVEKGEHVLVMEDPMFGGGS